MFIWRKCEIKLLFREYGIESFEKYFFWDLSMYVVIIVYIGIIGNFWCDMVIFVFSIWKCFIDL